METRIFLLDKMNKHRLRTACGWDAEVIAVVTADENNEPVVPPGRNIAEKYCLAAL